jgi:hypothetical protein
LDRPSEDEEVVLSDAVEISADHQWKRPEPIGRPARGNVTMSESGFERREEGFEAKFHAEGDQKFRLEMRRDKLFAQWVAGQLELSGDEAEEYAKTVIRADLQEPGDQDVIAKVKADLAAKGIEISEAELQEELDLCAEDAAAENG